jgi:Asp-tRNA(Asn)/Glu-tRNA(Gln) amidotransferase A subunit family amidase
VYSVADWIEMCGYDSTCGLVNNALKPLSEDALFVRVLNELGAIPIFRSSVSQNSGGYENCFTKETNNSIWGRGLNPHKKDFSTGGSCGGEAALVSTYSVGMGFGVDVFGDTRYPASCCGVCAFKPTSKRMSEIGVTKVNKRTLWPAVITPIGRSMLDIKYFFQSLWDSKLLSKYDHNVLPMKFENKIFEE